MRKCLVILLMVVGCDVHKEPEQKPAPPQSVSKPVVVEPKTKPSPPATVAAASTQAAIIGANSIEIKLDRIIVLQSGKKSELVNKGSDYDLTGLAALLDTMKRENPSEEEIRIKADPSIKYDVAVKVMDLVRSAGFTKVSLSK